jgi:methylenetetrahydrofolate reductase (NADPH)
LLEEGPRRSLGNALSRACLEIIPLKGIEKKTGFIPAGTEVAITCSPDKGIPATLELTRQLAGKGFDLIPHVAARMVEDEHHLRDILLQLAELEIDRLFVVGGDAEKPVGRFDSSLQLLEAMEGIDHGIEKIGVGAYPEGHPLIDEATLFRYLQGKQPFASYMVTQMCFDPVLIVSWLRTMRSEGIELPAFIGVPGVADRLKLFRIAIKIGVGQSARFLKSNLKLVGKMVTPGGYSPDELLVDLAAPMDDTEIGISGVHIYTFNQLETTEEWRTGMIKGLEEGSI